MNYVAAPKRYQWQKSIGKGGEEFHSELIRHFENDRPDVH